MESWDTNEDLWILWEYLWEYHDNTWATLILRMFSKHQMRSLPLVIKDGNGHVVIQQFYVVIMSRWWIFHCHVRSAKSNQIGIA